MFFDFFIKEFPFFDNTIKELYASMKSESVNYPSYLSNDLKDLFKKIFVKNPKNRYTIEQIISHPWVAKYIII